MSELETNDGDPAADTAPGEPAGSRSVDVTHRPAPEWLDQVEGEIGDVDVVLKCLARDSATMCKSCHDLSATGELEGRPVLARCASTKQPR